MLDLRLEGTAFRTTILDPERHFEHDQHEERQPEVPEKQPAGHAERSRNPTPRTVSIQPGSPSLRRRPATWTSIVFDEPLQARLPDLLEQAAAAQRGAGIAGERCEQLELLRRQVELDLVEKRAPRALVDLEVADPQRGGDTFAARPTAGDRTDAGDQLAQPERLDDVVVGAELEPDDAVGFFSARGDDDDRHAASARAAAGRRRARPCPAGAGRAGRCRARPRQAPRRRLPHARRRSPRGVSPSASGTAIASSSSTIRTLMPRILAERSAFALGTLPNLCDRAAKAW